MAVTVGPSCLSSSRVSRICAHQLMSPSASPTLSTCNQTHPPHPPVTTRLSLSPARSCLPHSNEPPKITELDADPAADIKPQDDKPSLASISPAHLHPQVQSDDAHVHRSLAQPPPSRSAHPKRTRPQLNPVGPGNMSAARLSADHIKILRLVLVLSALFPF